MYELIERQRDGHKVNLKPEGVTGECGVIRVSVRAREWRV